jgi:hypothetical protein
VYSIIQVATRVHMRRSWQGEDVARARHLS